jgi:hypothetical protein
VQPPALVRAVSGPGERDRRGRQHFGPRDGLHQTARLTAPLPRDCGSVELDSPIEEDQERGHPRPRHARFSRKASAAQSMSWRSCPSRCKSPAADARRTKRRRPALRYRERVGAADMHQRQSGGGSTDRGSFALIAEAGRPLDRRSGVVPSSSDCWRWSGRCSATNAQLRLRSGSGRCSPTLS